MTAIAHADCGPDVAEVAARAPSWPSSRGIDDLEAERQHSRSSQVLTSAPRAHRTAC